MVDEIDAEADEESGGAEGESADAEDADVLELVAEEDEWDDELAEEDDEETGAEEELDAEEVPVGVKGGDVEGEEEADRFSRADVSSDLPLAKKPLDDTLFSFSTPGLASASAPLGETGCDETGEAADEEAGDLTAGEAGSAMARSRGVGLLGLGCV